MLKSLWARAAQQAVDVLAFGQQHHLAGKPPGKEHFAGAQGRLTPGAVAVKQQGDARGKTRKTLDLLRREGRAQDAHGIVVAELVQGQHVHVAFGEQGFALGDDAPPGLSQAVEVLAFLVQGRVGAVDVFGLVRIINNPPAESDDLVGEVFDGKDEPAPEAVVGPPSVRAAQQTGLHGHAVVKTGAAQDLGQRLPLARGPAQAKTLHNLGAQAAPGHVGLAVRSRRRAQPGGKMRRRQLVHAQHLLPHRTAAAFFALAFRVGRAALQGNARLGRQLFKGFFKVQSVNTAVKIENVARSVAAKTVEQALVLVDGKRRLGFLMKRAGGHPARTVALQLHIAAHHVHDIKALFDGADGVFALHDGDVPPGLFEQPVIERPGDGGFGRGCALNPR